MIEPDEHTRAAMQRLRKINDYTWHLKLSLRPRVCNWSGEKIPMFTYAYRGWRIIEGPSEGILITRWMSVNTYLIETIKGNLK